MELRLQTLYYLNIINLKTMRIIKAYLALLLLTTPGLLYGQENAVPYQPAKENIANRAKFQDMRFGMFIHWGVFSVLGNGEWVMDKSNIYATDYGRLQHIFNPQQFNAAKWVAAAKLAGMHYITFVSRHHDGFSNWDTKQSEWKITNTPYAKDPLKELAAECKKQGIKLFIYYSLLDWTRSDYQYETGRSGQGTGRTKKSDWPSYLNFMKAQLKELLTGYGEISGIWFDGDWDQRDKAQLTVAKVDWHYAEIYSLIHQLQPGCLIGNNHHLIPFAGEDFQMFEKDLPGFNTTGFGKAEISQLPLETCETMNDSWGFNITDRHYKSTKDMIHYLVNAAGRNANFLLNIGPLPDGAIQKEFTDSLKNIGLWMNKYGKSIYNTRGNVIPAQEWGVVSGKGKTSFVHILKPKESAYVFLPGFAKKIKSATSLNEGIQVKFKQVSEGLFVYLDRLKLDSIDTIIELTE